jgi:hypothetical protein
MGRLTEPPRRSRSTAQTSIEATRRCTAPRPRNLYNLEDGGGLGLEGGGGVGFDPGGGI